MNAEERMEEESGRSGAPISFGFSKRKETKVLLNKEHGAPQDEPDYVTSLESNVLQSLKPTAEKKELVIPLIKRNQWRQAATERACTAAGMAATAAGDVDDLRAAAVQELLADARRHGEEESTEAESSSTAAIPLLMENKAPEGFETDDKLDVSLRPEEPSDADYEQVPVEDYGWAMLKGMGWKEGEGVGKNKRSDAFRGHAALCPPTVPCRAHSRAVTFNSRLPSFSVTKPVEAVPHPKGMGLGADRSALLQNQQQEKRGSSTTSGRKPGDVPRGASGAEEERPLTFKKGVHCVAERGPHRGLYGTIEGTDEDNCRCVVKLAIGGQSVSMSQYYLKLIRAAEFEKNSKCINKTKYDEYKKAESAKPAKSRDNDGRENGRGNADGAGSPMGSSDSLKRKHEDVSASNNCTGIGGRSDVSKQSRTATSKENSLWLQQLLRVRLVDKRYKRGAYYNTKIIVEDVIGVDCVVCRTDGGTVLDGITQSMLETVVPRDESSLVMIVAGESKGQLAEILKKDKAQCIATVQPVAHRERVVKVSYDDICEWTGDSRDLFDY